MPYYIDLGKSIEPDPFNTAKHLTRFLESGNRSAWKVYLSDITGYDYL